MTSKQRILATIVAFLISSVLTTLYYMLTDEANKIPYRRPEMNYAALQLNHLIYAGLLVLLFPHYYRIDPRALRGFLFGMLIAALMFLPQAIVIRAIWTIEFNTIFALNTLAHLLIGGLMGLATSFFYTPVQSENT